jgi:glutathione S-transferase
MDEVRGINPFGRIPALVLDDGETLVDSGTIIDHLDEVYGRGRAFTPAGGADRRTVLKVAARMMGACEKGLQAAYERNQHPADKLHQSWIDDCIAQMTNALSTIDAMIERGSPYAE